MTKKEAIKIFEEKKVRTAWDDETEEWYFSVIDAVSYTHLRAHET